MSSYCVGCDNIVGGESGLIHKVAQVLEKEGNSCEELSVGPNYVQTKGKESGSKGKIAVFIVGGADVGTYVDFMIGMRSGGYYHYKYIWFAFASWTATTDKWITENGLKKTGLVRAHDDNFSRQSDLEPWLGKSTDYFFSKNKSNMGYVYGQTPEELAKKILGGGESSSDSDSKSSASSIKESLKRAVSGWDGEVEIRLIEDTVHVNKIKDPTTTKLVINEFENVIYDSITVTDINPQTTNKLTLHYKDYDLTLSDDLLIQRFGEIPLEIEPDSTVTSYDTAVAFLQRTWNKIRRDDGRQVELKVDGDSKWKVGLWVRVYLPSFYIDDYMYIVRLSADEDGSTPWLTGLTLVDFPPSFGEPQAETEEEEETTDDEDTEDTSEETTS